MVQRYVALEMNVFDLNDDMITDLYEEDLKRAEYNASILEAFNMEVDHASRSLIETETSRLTFQHCPIFSYHAGDDLEDVRKDARRDTSLGDRVKRLVLPSVTRRLASSRTADEAEGQAALMGLQALRAVYSGRVNLETDCKSLPVELSDSRPSRVITYGLILDIKSSLAAFEGHKVNHVPRDYNALAHELAADARHTGDQRLIDTVPARLKELMIFECILILE
ncbi:serine threonine-protein kinase endoribonuclease ire-1 [Hordeum vulgare]|nr:serine threonine-protein kinase endoribonuclease ire-1 [Hordeum vulgare]